MLIIALSVYALGYGATARLMKRSTVPWGSGGPLWDALMWPVYMLLGLAIVIVVAYMALDEAMKRRGI